MRGSVHVPGTRGIYGSPGHRHDVNVSTCVEKGGPSALPELANLILRNGTCTTLAPKDDQSCSSSGVVPLVHHIGELRWVARLGHTERPPRWHAVHRLITGSLCNDCQRLSGSAGGHHHVLVISLARWLVGSNMGPATMYIFLAVWKIWDAGLGNLGS